MIHVSVNCQPEKKFLFVCLFSGFVVCFLSLLELICFLIYMLLSYGERNNEGGVPDTLKSFKIKEEGGMDSCLIITLTSED